MACFLGSQLHTFALSYGSRSRYFPLLAGVAGVYGCERGVLFGVERGAADPTPNSKEETTLPPLTFFWVFLFWL